METVELTRQEWDFINLALIRSYEILSVMDHALFMRLYGLSKGYGSMPDSAEFHDAVVAAPAGWISVADRLPEKERDVLVHMGRATVCVGRLLNPVEFNTVLPDMEWFVEGEWCDFVTHWMPLPEPPNRSEQEQGKE